MQFPQATRVRIGDGHRLHERCKIAARHQQKQQQLGDQTLHRLATSIAGLASGCNFGCLRKALLSGRISGTMLDPTLAIRIAIGVYRFTERRIQVIGSSAWPMADGKVTNGKIVRDDLLGWGIELTYFYVAMSEYYSGTYFRAFRRKRSAEAFAERFPPQTAIPVRYKSAKPEISTLLLSDLTLHLAGL